MYCACGKRSENKDTGECASCARERRKAESMTLKEPKPIKKVSEKMDKSLKQYALLKAKFMLRKWCAVHGKPCLPIEVHHQMGRVGFADDKEIPLLIDVRYWIPVCRAAHNEIENNPTWAKENGYSCSRLAKN